MATPIICQIRLSESTESIKYEDISQANGLQKQAGAAILI